MLARCRHAHLCASVAHLCMRACKRACERRGHAGWETQARSFLHSATALTFTHMRARAAHAVLHAHTPVWCAPPPCRGQTQGQPCPPSLPCTGHGRTRPAPGAARVALWARSPPAYGGRGTGTQVVQGAVLRRMGPNGAVGGGQGKRVGRRCTRAQRQGASDLGCL